MGEREKGRKGVEKGIITLTGIRLCRWATLQMKSILTGGSLEGHLVKC
jgi:hypothetical protein